MVLFHGPDSISMYARPGKTLPRADTRLGTLAPIIGLKSTSLVYLFSFAFPLHLFLGVRSLSLAPVDFSCRYRFGPYGILLYGISA